MTGSTTNISQMPMRMHPPRRFANWLTYALLVAGAIAMLVPFVFMLSSSLKTDPEIQHVPPSILPKTIEWHNYPDALGREKMDLGRTLPNTVVITVCCVLGQIVSSSLVGFGFARFRFRGRNALFLLMLSTMMLPAQVTMIPLFVLFRGLGWIDTFLPLIVPSWLAGPFFVFMFRQFFAAVPEELMEAARIDGASTLRIYWQIMMPLCGPVVAITAIYTFMNTWNDFLNPLIYLNSPENRTLSLALASFNGQYGVTHVNQLMAASFITMIPCLLLFAAAQRYFVENIAMTGGKS
ncbi:MAG: carbohydrate ABC transporter permease [Tepidisphaeraceae bacterium]|jgi:ABC-type glycerol-3-phosphate transport system permease component